MCKDNPTTSPDSPASLMKTRLKVAGLCAIACAESTSIDRLLTLLLAAARMRDQEPEVVEGVQ